MSAAIAYDFMDKIVPGVSQHLQIMNATTATDTFYPGLDFTTLSWIERLWAQFYIFIGNPIIATGLLSFGLHEIVYFGRCIPWLIIDEIPYFHQWKIQPNKKVSRAQMWKCTKVVLLTHFTCEAPLILAFHPICCYFGMATYEVPFTSWGLMALQIAFFFVFEDTFHYWAHRALHYGPLYKNIHKLHHEFSAPIGLAAEYAHPLEVLILAQGTISGPFLYAVFRSDLHIFTVYLWITLRLWQAVDAHSGYDFPWSLRTFIPFWAGADHHDFHHAAFVNCFSTSFRWWDYSLGTDSKYHAYKERVAASKAKTAKERAEFERREMEEVEKEGVRAERLAEAYGKRAVKTE
ncbi:methylsterol monooxygenase [Cryptococcus wingfieldii CBS 7118]|uniref:Methylsterol monooxygenase n=1 Tax=Cryptococcus wingfieldii CBS 7118 TaxID=1295528 RepID=A0A1E3K2F9_9TREE|nr:methylsterol monooxygenase [Cryptococcus wingfieldii CBS 7118]ODO07199.1 methylsterol monooxygenase [Cryptococcus wingfieldii CBS 7118]